MRIQAMDMVQPPGIGMALMAAMEAHQTTVTAVLAAKSSAETARKPRWDGRSEAMDHR
jgi:hypothetical protein